MLKGRKKELWAKADAERQRCRKWLLDYMRPGQPKRVTKAALLEPDGPGHELPLGVLGSHQEGLLGFRHLRGIIAAGEEMPVAIGRHLNRGMPEPGLHQLERQFQAAVGAAVDAPRRIEVAQRMQPRIFRTPLSVDGFVTLADFTCLYCVLERHPLTRIPMT